MARVDLDNFLRVTRLDHRQYSDLRQELDRRLRFVNPAWEENERMGRWNGRTPRYIVCWQGDEYHPILPRGYISQFQAMLARLNEPFDLVDTRRLLPDVDFTFTGSLRDYQQEAVDAVLRQDFGTLAAPTGAGKTVLALATIAARRQPTLIVVHTKELLQQWVDRIGTYLHIPADQVGRIGGGKLQVGDKITVALVQSLYKCDSWVKEGIGFLIVDECHRTPSRTFTEAVTSFDCRYQLGLSATPYRRDGLSRLIFFYLGDLVHEIGADRLRDEGHIMQADVVYRETDFETWYDQSAQYQKVLKQLTEDRGRNALIMGDVAREADRGLCLVLSDRKAHCAALADGLRRQGVKAGLLTGDLTERQRAAALDSLSNGTRVLVATGQLIGEGFDLPELASIFLATPIRFSGRVLQYIGRILRPAPGKRQARVFDYVDVNVGVLRASAKERKRVYEQGE